MIPVQLSYHNEITDVGNWSFVGSNVLVMNESTMKMIYEMNHILNCRCEIKRSYDPGCSTQLIFIMWPWFDSQSQRHMWVEYAVGSLLAPRSFSPCSPVFPSPEKPTVRVNPIRPRMHGHMLNELLNTHINKQILKIKLFGPFFLL